MKRNRYCPLVVVTGESMRPGYRDGDLVVVRPSWSYRSGDVVVFQEQLDGFHVIHRIVGFRKDECLTKGDANSSPDPRAVGTAEIAGKVLLRLPKIGAMIRSFQSTWGPVCRK